MATAASTTRKRGALRASNTGNSAGDATRARIMGAAERLFAQHGIDAVSVRDITAAAKANSAAIHYHFGSKQRLIEDILASRASWLVERREQLLAEAEAGADDGASISVHDVVAALVLPVAELAADHRRGGQHYIRFVAAVLSHPEFLPLVIGAYEPGMTRYRELLEQVTPHLSPGVRELRFALAKDMVNRTLGYPGGPVHTYLDHQAPDAEASLPGRLIDFIAGGLVAPDDRAPAPKPAPGRARR